jgi:hypothetical protein
MRRENRFDDHFQPAARLGDRLIPALARIVLRSPVPKQVFDIASRPMVSDRGEHIGERTLWIET